MKKETIVLPFCEEDFQNSDYMTNKDCPLARLVKRFLHPNPNIGINISFNSEIDDVINVMEVRLNNKVIKDIFLWTLPGFASTHYKEIIQSINNKTFKNATVKLQFV